MLFFGQMISKVCNTPNPFLTSPAHRSSWCYPPGRTLGCRPTNRHCWSSLIHVNHRWTRLDSRNEEKDVRNHGFPKKMIYNWSIPWNLHIHHCHVCTTVYMYLHVSLCIHSDFTAGWYWNILQHGICPMKFLVQAIWGSMAKHGQLFRSKFGDARWFHTQSLRWQAEVSLWTGIYVYSVCIWVEND